LPVYTYTAKNLKGEEMSGEYETATVDSLEQMLNQKGYFIVKVEKKGDAFSLSQLLGKVKIKDIAIFCRQFSVIINSGITITEAVSIIRDQTENKKFKKILDQVHEEIQKGKVLSEALSIFPDVFPDFLVSMVKVGEASGSLDLIFSRLADYYEKDNKIKRKVKSAMTYPAILATLTVGVVALLMIKVLPMFADILSSMGGELPTVTKVLMGMSDFLVKNLLIISLVLVFLMTAISYYLKTDSGLYLMDSLKLKIPFLRSTVRKIITSRFARSMGILLKSGIPVVTAIDIMSNLVGNRVVERKFLECRDDIKKGRTLSESVSSIGVFSPILTHMVKIGEKTGELDQMLTRTASFFDDEVEESLERLTTLMEPFMLIVLATVVGIIIASVMLPMTSIMSTLG